MAKSRSDDEDFEEKPRPGSAPRHAGHSADDEEDDRPARRSAAARRGDQDDDEDRPRRKRRKDGALSGIIPYRNLLALAAYYCGFGSLICILGSVALRVSPMGRGNATLISILTFGVGGLLTILAVVCGVLGLNYAANHPKAKGKGHAVIGLVMGGLEIVGLIGLAFFGSAIKGR